LEAPEHEHPTEAAHLSLEFVMNLFLGLYSASAALREETWLEAVQDVLVTLFVVAVVLLVLDIRTRGLDPSGPNDDESVAD
ncbi:hypothetical protein, partial [Microbacterium sp.]|uniref:hypothetical protein n=1 Tax=Microbacterium sp. TaxID=51671 RepID=UPI0027341A5E